MSIANELQTLTTNVQGVLDGKACIAQAITSKGVATADDASFDTMAVNVGLIESGGEDDGHNLPNEYKEYKYIQSSGTQYIDTGYVANAQTEVHIKSKRTSAQGWNASDFGSFNPKAALSGAYFAWGSASDVTGLDADDSAKSLYADSSIEYKVNLTGAYAMDGTKLANFGSPTWAVGQYPMFIMARSSASGAPERKCKMKVFYFSVSENGILKHEFIPAMRVSDSALGMFDTVTNMFKTNAGTGDFSGEKL